MISASSTLITLLGSSNQLAITDLYTFTLNNGTVLRYTGGDAQVTPNAYTFVVGPVIKRSRWRLTLGTQVDDMQLEMAAPPSVAVGSIPFLQAVRQGYFDRAQVLFQQAIGATPLDFSAGLITRFSGYVAECDVGRFSVKMTVASLLANLQLPLPRNLYQPGCLNALYDGGCTLSKASYAVSGTITSATKTSISSGVSQSADYFDQGIVTFTSGALNGTSATVKQYSGGTFSFVYPLILTPGVGDTFTAYPGCDKTQATCTNKFGNLANFRGFPYVPNVDTVLGNF